MAVSYVDYTYYTGSYKGAAIAQLVFDRMAMRASAIIDQATFGRAAAVVTAATDLVTIEAIKFAVCAVAEEYQLLDKREGGQGGEVASESVGGMSVSYVSNSTSKLSDYSKLARAAKMYLWPTGLMYGGLDMTKRTAHDAF